jgi:hypothetical protein
MPLIGFKKEFSEKIINGTKVHTIRASRKRPIKSGDTLILAIGVRTKQYKELMRVTCKRVQKIRLEYDKESSDVNVIVEGSVLSFTDMIAFSKRDGFESVYDFFVWFFEKSTLISDLLEGDTIIFEGDIIIWGDGIKY